MAEIFIKGAKIVSKKTDDTLYFRNPIKPEKNIMQKEIEPIKKIAKLGLYEDNSLNIGLEQKIILIKKQEIIIFFIGVFKK